MGVPMQIDVLQEFTASFSCVLGVVLGRVRGRDSSGAAGFFLLEPSMSLQLFVLQLMVCGFRRKAMRFQRLF